VMRAAGNCATGGCGGHMTARSIRTPSATPHRWRRGQPTDSCRRIDRGQFADRL
jgi:hypothetical protein